MTDSLRESRVLSAVTALVDSLLDDFDIVDLLTELTSHCADLLDIDAAGLLLADPRHRLHLMAATSEQSRELELFQLQSDEGPCRDCYTTGAAVSIADLSAEQQRWPHFVPAAIHAEFASVHAVPMRAAGTTVGALGLFGTDTGELNEADRLVAQTLAHVACVAILQTHAPTPETLPAQLNAALNNRIVVEQAKGYLGELFNVSVHEAFTLLRAHARAHGGHLTTIARNLIREPGARRQILGAIRSETGAHTPPPI